MKKTILFTIIICFANIAKAQGYPTPVSDTLRYLRYVVSNKQIYIGQPFSLLHNDLLINVKLFRPFGDIHFQKNSETLLSLSFKYAATADDLYATYPRLVVVWQAPYLYLPVSDSLRETYKRQGIGWNVPLYNRYKDLIIRDIYVHE